MRYMGSKRRIAKHILPIILAEYKDGMDYIEPFVGGANTIDKVSSNIPRLGYDVNPYLIAMWQAAAKGWLPPESMTEEEYNHIKNNKDEQPHLTGYAGFALSFGGKWFGGWSRDSTGKRDHTKEAYRNAVKQFPLIRDVKFECKSVFDLDPERQSLIYCDPPYLGTTKYRDGFDHKKFYEWCRKMRDKGHIVFVSEYEMPDDFECFWESKPIANQVSKTQGTTGTYKQATERLFRLR